MQGSAQIDDDVAKMLMTTFVSISRLRPFNHITFKARRISWNGKKSNNMRLHHTILLPRRVVPFPSGMTSERYNPHWNRSSAPE